MRVTIQAENAESSYRQIIQAGNHTFFADVGPEKGGEDTAADPHQLFYGAWGACTAMTIQMYARRKGWPLANVRVEFEESSRDGLPLIRKEIHLKGNLAPEQVDALKKIAEKCPVNKLITGDKHVQADIVSG